MTAWVVELGDGKQVFFSSPERAAEFVEAYEHEHGVKLTVRERKAL